MPYKPRKPFHHPGCPELVEPGKLYCEKHLPLHACRLLEKSIFEGGRIEVEMNSEQKTA